MLRLGDKRPFYVARKLRYDGQIAVPLARSCAPVRVAGHPQPSIGYRRDQRSPLTGPSRHLYNLSAFTPSDMTRCGSELRRLGAGATSMEQAADRIVRSLYDQLSGPDGGSRACALVRLFVTVPYSSLDADLQSFVRAVTGSAPKSQVMKCLTLLATAGEIDAWNSRHTSVSHKALPLASVESVSRSPMIAQLVRQLGIALDTLVDPAPGLVVDADQHTFNVFHVSEAKGCPYIPAQQEFVVPYGIRSVLGFGGLLPPGELFATILFSRTPIPRDVAELFKTLALNVKVALLPFVGRSVFA